MPWASICTVIHGKEVVNASDGVRRQCRVIHDQFVYPAVEGRCLLRGRQAQVIKRQAEECSIIQLRDSGVLC